MVIIFVLDEEGAWRPSAVIVKGFYQLTAGELINVDFSETRRRQGSLIQSKKYFV